MFLMFFHTPFFFISFSWIRESTVMGLFCWYWIIEDFWWFVLNDFYGIRNFRPGYIFWHKRWIWFLPVSYFWGIFLGTILLILGGLHV